MTDTPTPETDAEVEARGYFVTGPNNYYVKADYARSLERRLAAAIAERDAARQFAEEAARRYNDLLAETRVLRCAFCDAVYPDGTPATQADALTAHVMVCEKHPMRGAEKRAEQAEAALHWIERNVIESLKDKP